MDTEAVQLCALVDVPEEDGEVDGSRDKMWRIISRTLIVRIQQACDAAGVSSQNLVRQHVNCTRHPQQGFHVCFITIYNVTYTGQICGF